LQAILGGPIEVDELDGAVAALVFVVPFPFAAEPSKHLAVAVNGCRNGFELFEELAYSVRGEPRVEFRDRDLDFVAHQHAGFAATLELRDVGGDGRPADFRRVCDHRNWTVPASLMRRSLTRPSLLPALPTQSKDRDR
jgi:hypothetical protein